MGIAVLQYVEPLAETGDGGSGAGERWETQLHQQYAAVLQVSEPDQGACRHGGVNPVRSWRWRREQRWPPLCRAYALGVVTCPCDVQPQVDLVSLVCSAEPRRRQVASAKKV